MDLRLSLPRDWLQSKEVFWLPSWQGVPRGSQRWLSTWLQKRSLADQWSTLLSVSVRSFQDDCHVGQHTERKTHSNCGWHSFTRFVAYVEQKGKKKEVGLPFKSSTLLEWLCFFFYFHCLRTLDCNFFSLARWTHTSHSPGYSQCFSGTGPAPSFLVAVQFAAC